MALNIKTVETAPFEWTWDEDPEVKCVLIPLSKELERKVAKSTSIEMGAEGGFKVWQQAEHLIMLAATVTESWEGVGGDGKPLAPTRQNFDAVWNNPDDAGSRLVIAIVDRAREKYAEVCGLAGKSQTQPSGTTGESTAEDVTSPVSFSLPAEASSGNAR